MPPEAEPGLDALRSILPVSRETYDRLAKLVALVKRWQRAENLIAPGTVADIWTRHVADSAQLVPLFPDARHWLDLGSGGGFPGLVIAILIAEPAGDRLVHLVESNARKCAFLRTAARETRAPARIHQGRIESILAAIPGPVDVITARALAPLDSLLELTAHLIGPAKAAFFKGVDFQREVAEASHTWDFDLVVHPSRISEGSAILEIPRAVRRI